MANPLKYPSPLCQRIAPARFHSLWANAKSAFGADLAGRLESLLAPPTSAPGFTLSSKCLSIWESSPV